MEPICEIILEGKQHYRVYNHTRESLLELLNSPIQFIELNLDSYHDTGGNYFRDSDDENWIDAPQPTIINKNLIQRIL